MKNPTIAKILAIRFAGNYFSDATHFDTIHDFAMDASNSIADRAAAIRHMVKNGMGIESNRPATDEQVVAEYVADMDGVIDQGVAE